MKEIAVFFLLFLSLLLLACGKSAEQAETEKTGGKLSESVKSLEEGAEGLAEAMKNMTESIVDSNVEAVDFRELKELLPEKLADMTRTSATGEKNSMMGMKMSVARADYTGDDGQSVHIELTDLGTLKGVAAMATYGWMMADIDRETDTGYEKTMTFEGHKGYEKYESETRRGEIHLIVADRFAVEVSGNGIDMDDLKNALKKIDLNELEKMKDSGVST
jgi:hypothetical protein